MQINICLTADSNYIKYMAATMASILINSDKEDHITFYLIVENITYDDKNKIMKLKKIKECEIILYENIDLSVYNIFFQKTNNKIYWSPACFYRLEIPSLLKNIDKILYLDCDIIVRKNIKELYTIDISDIYLAAVTHPINIDNFKTRIGLKIEDKYFCSGMLLINNKLFIEDNIKDKCISSLRQAKVIYAPDQDALVLATNNKVKIIDEKYSYFAYRGYHKTPEDINNLNIIHYASAKKPWLEDIDGCYYPEEFWKYFCLTPWFQENPAEYINIMINQKINLLIKENTNFNNITINNNKEITKTKKDIDNLKIEIINSNNNFNNLVNKLVWLIPIKSVRNKIRNDILRPDQTRPDQTRPDQTLICKEYIYINNIIIKNKLQPMLHYKDAA